MVRHAALAQGLTAAATAEVLERGPPHRWTLGCRLRRGRTHSVDVRAVRGFPPALGEAQQADLKAAVQEPPAESGIELANWNWKVVRQFVSDRYCIGLSRSSCLNWLHRLGFALKRPKKRLLKADAAKREPSWRNTPPVARGARMRSQDILRRRGPLSCGRRTARQMGAEGRTGLGGLEQPALWRESKLLLGGLPGDGQVEWMEAGRQQQLWNLGCLLGATERGAHRAVDRDLGQRAGAPWRGGAGSCRHRAWDCGW